MDVRGREYERRIPRSTISSDTGFEVIEPPRSAWIEFGMAMFRATASARKSFRHAASSAFATSHPAVRCISLGCGFVFAG